MAGEDRSLGHGVSEAVSAWTERIPRQSRGSEAFPRGSTKWMLLHLIREVREPDWSAVHAARHLVLWSDSDLDLLQAARTRLVLLEPLGGRPSSVHARALMSLDLAINEVSMTLARSVEPGGREGRE